MSDGDQEKLTFHVVDYVVWSLILAASVGIGIYYACTGDRQRSSEEFLVANRRMNPIPVAMSLAVSFISAVTFLGLTAEAYSNGVMIWLHAIALMMACLLAGVFFVPVFHRLNITSANEYLELRFSKACRLLGSIIVILNMFVYMGAVLYGPALALSQVAGLNLWGSVLTVGLACTFYTTIGGLKAVIWTDVFQMCVMISGLLAVIIKGSANLGGFRNVLKIVDEGNRLDLFVMSTDVTVRHTFWGLTIGATFMFLSILGTNQAQVQRYLACKTLKIAHISLSIAAVIQGLIVSCAATAGLVMYAYYADCDPLSTGAVAKKDQMIPYFTLDLFRDYPGLPGLFLSAVFSASLSTISSGLNAVAAVTTEDLIKPLWKGQSDARYTFVCKLMALTYGILTIGFAFLASALGDILKIVLNFFGMFGGPILGLFSVGMFFPWTNSKGAFGGTIIGLIFAFWLGIGAHFYPTPYSRPPISTHGCAIFNATKTLGMTTMTTAYATLFADDVIADDVTMMPTEDTFPADGFSLSTDAASVKERPAIAAFYTLSYTWYAVVSWMVTIFSALVISVLTGPTNPRKLDPRLINPLVDAMYCCLPEIVKKPLRCGVGEDFIPAIPSNDEHKKAEYEKVAVVDSTSMKEHRV